jgi:hypothetical protein
MDINRPVAIDQQLGALIQVTAVSGRTFKLIGTEERHPAFLSMSLGVSGTDKNPSKQEHGSSLPNPRYLSHNTDGPYWRPSWRKRGLNVDR